MLDYMYHMTLKHLKSHVCRYIVKVFPLLRKVITLEKHCTRTAQSSRGG